MTTDNNAEELLPSAKRLIKSLRDLGYDFASAVADIVDNSIEAGASRVDIFIDFDGDDSYVRISDNGKGMSAAQLKEAMRFGSERDYSEEDLGKFGLGLKTASMSQCQAFYVATREKTTVDITSRGWDLHHIERTNKWEVLTPKDEELLSLLNEQLAEHAGTVVLWQRLDRVLGFKHPYGPAAKKRLHSMCREAEEHLAMVFHKFLNDQTSRGPLEIYLNWNRIIPWDPFASAEPETKELTPVTIKLSHEGQSGKIIMQPYVLPAKEEFSSLESFQRASGPASWNQQQGFYIYRADRMIQSGGWCGLRTRDEHTKLCRIELNFLPTLDNAFKINVAKMRVQLPEQIREDIEKAISPAVRLARDYYDRKKAPKHPPQSQSPSDPSANKPSKKDEKDTDEDNGGSKSSSTFHQSSYHSEADKFTLDEIEKRILDVTDEKDRHIIIQSFNRLRHELITRK